MPNDVARTEIMPGDFPFPISDGPQESRYLTWIRNHSNYMAVRGLLDYFRAVAVLARGALVNALIGLPILLVIAVLVAMLNVLPSAPGFYLTRIVLIIAVAAIVLFPFAASLLKVGKYRRTFWRGTDSSVKTRDRWERLFGFSLVAIVAVAAFESLPVFLDRFHFWVYDRGIRWPELATLFGSVVAVYSVADKLLSMLGHMARKVVMAAVGVLGLLMPLLVVLFVADFLVFSHPQLEGLWQYVPLVVVAFLIVGIVVVLLYGIAKRAFSTKDVLWMLGLLVGSLVLAGAVFAADDTYFEWTKETEERLALETQVLPTKREFAADFASLVRNVKERPGPKLAELARWIAESHEDDENLPAQSGTAEPQPIGSEPDLEALLGRIFDAGLAARLFEVPQFVLATEDWIKRGRPQGEKYTKLTLELEQLRERISLLDGLPQSIPELVKLLVSEPERFDKLVVVHDYLERPPYPILMSVVPEAEPLDATLGAWGTVLKEAWREVITSAVYSPSRYPTIYKATAGVRQTALWPKVTLVLAIAVLVWCFCWLAVDVNLTSIHGLYRDRLAAAFLIGKDTRGDVDIEEDLDLGDLARHEAGSIAPYHLINVALNLQGSTDIGIRDRKSDFFIFSKRFIGGRRTGYCRGEVMERVFPQMSLSTAMAISAAAASPNMGRATSPGLVALMTLLNVRLGIWIPNPGVLQQRMAPRERAPEDDDGPAPGFSFPEVFREELTEVARRWQQLPAGAERRLATGTRPTVVHRLVGIGFSGGGIRSATINLGISQALHRRGVFDHIDYMSTVSGGGYLGSSLSALMRRRRPTEAEVSGRVSVRTEAGGEKVVRVEPNTPGRAQRLMLRVRRLLGGSHRESSSGPREYRYASFAQLAVADGATVHAGQRLLSMDGSIGKGPGSFGEQFRWRVRPAALLRELLSRLDETHRWVNVSDGGHIENLAAIELLRRRCKYVLIGDGEADPNHHFNGLATLIRSARIDLGIHIDIDVGALRLREDRLSRGHWAIGSIVYPDETEPGYLLYLKSSVTGDEDEVIREYRTANPSFPHESTADQMFNEGQFEAYRSLGQHIGEHALKFMKAAGSAVSFGDLEAWFKALEEGGRATTAPGA